MRITRRQASFSLASIGPIYWAISREVILPMKKSGKFYTAAVAEVVTGKVRTLGTRTTGPTAHGVIQLTRQGLCFRNSCRKRRRRGENDVERPSANVFWVLAGPLL
jgi:hypothetical protein